MRSFLRGFADELIKIADGSWSDIPRPASTATGYEPPANTKPPNSLPPSGAALASIPKQRMEWSPKPKQDTWEPSPGFRLPTPKPAETPKPVVKSSVTKKKPGGNGAPAFESDTQRSNRLNAESQNKGSVRHGSPEHGAALNYDKLTLKPGEKTKSELAKVTNRKPGTMAEQVSQGAAAANARRDPGAATIDVQQTETSGGPRGSVAHERQPIPSNAKVRAPRAPWES